MKYTCASGAPRLSLAKKDEVGLLARVVVWGTPVDVVRAMGSMLWQWGATSLYYLYILYIHKREKQELFSLQGSRGNNDLKLRALNGVEKVDVKTAKSRVHRKSSLQVKQNDARGCHTNTRQISLNMKLATNGLQKVNIFNFCFILTPPCFMQYWVTILLVGWLIGLTRAKTIQSKSRSN